MSFFKSQDGHILCRVNLEWTKYRGVIIWSGYMASGYIFTSSKKVTDYLKVELKAYDAYLNNNYIMDENEPLSK